ncbi:MAG: hypothetical protein JRI25_27180 [Deltaproteobacteria bacterium]|nr:hypothetical protein [Deltaproteobacteria bacterium]
MGRVRHGSDESRLGERFGELGEAQTGGNADEQLPGERLAECRIGEDLVRRLWLHRQDGDVSRTRPLRVVGRRPNAVALPQLTRALLSARGDQELIRRNLAGGEETGQHRLSDGATADDRDALVREPVHGFGPLGERLILRT